MKVLFCTDGSDYSYRNLINSLALMPKDSVIDVINVIDIKNILLHKIFSEKHVIDPLQEFSDETLKKSKKIIKEKDFECGNIFSYKGNITDEILEHIEKNAYDLVVLGSHSKKKWLGSVCRKVINKIKIPSLIIKDEDEIKEEKTVLFAVDGSKNCLKSLENGIKIINKDNLKCSIINIYPGPESLPLEITMDNKWLADCISKQKELASETVADVNEILSKYVNFYEKIIKEGEPAEEILNYLNNNKTDLIIMGTHSRSGLSEFLLGSVSKRVLDNSKNNILIVPSF